MNPFKERIYASEIHEISNLQSMKENKNIYLTETIREEEH